MLSALGITRWRLRETTPVSVSEPLPQKPMPRFIILVDSSQSDKDLLSKIIQALKVTEAECEIHWVEQPSSLQGQSWPKVPMIAFGERLTAFLPTQAILTLGLSLLAQNPAAKKALWNQLKTLV